MQAVALSFVLFMCLFTSGKSESTGCLKSTIRRPDYADLSSLKEEYSDGESVRIRCEIGYTGLFRATCTGTEWILTGRACQKKPCGHPGDTPNGDFQLSSGDDFVFGAVVEYTCKTGYRMMSRNRHRSCMASGWDNDIPVCEEVKCPVIELAGDLRASGNFEDGGYGDVIHFQCQSQKKQISGAEEIHCTEEGTWSAAIPTCREIQCETPAIPHGRITNSRAVFRDDDNLRYTCEAGYKPANERTPKCTKHGWTVTPECEEINCKLSPSTSPNTRRLPEGINIFRRGERVEIECSEGHRTITKKQTDSFLCGEDGEWPNRITPGCEEIHCSRREHDGHATLHWNYYKYTYRFNEAVTYSCGWGYTKTAEKATCKIDGWSPKQLCVDNNACATPTIKNGFVVEHDRNTVGFSCNSGFKLNTGGWWRTSSCSEGVWSVTPKCIGENECAAPPAADNVIYENQKDTYSGGESQEFECKPGYTSQLRQILCNNGQWEKPECKQDSNGCTAPPDVPNAIIVSQYQEFYENGTELKYACRLSYETEGKDKIICNAGNWTTRPTCLRQTPCDAPTIADNVNYPLKKETYLHGEFLQFECDPGYTSAHQNIKCQNGTWENPFCIRDHNLCTAPPRVENGNIIPPDQKIYSEGFEVKYTCERFYQFNGVDKITCRLGRWTDSPECIRKYIRFIILLPTGLTLILIH
ncbi:hypothetical protein ACEWY4_015059 [Coilia grayii]|uniref:Sushi domain-containing protein n=1 Tax=Coilia grayii TaxID=363190 RepID=A0ABD1JU07_9TELE